jgi:hypothetical protein
LYGIQEVEIQPQKIFFALLFLYCTFVSLCNLK